MKNQNNEKTVVRFKNYAKNYPRTNLQNTYFYKAKIKKLYKLSFGFIFH